MVLCAIFLIPMFILSIPLRIMKLLSADPEWLRDDNDPVYDANGIGTMLIIDGTLGLLLCMICMWFYLSNDVLVAVGIVGYLLLGIFLIVFLITWLQKRNRNKPYKAKEPSIFAHYWEAKKDKICPIIEWEED